jgi:hypothetical protein
LFLEHHGGILKPQRRLVREQKSYTEEQKSQGILKGDI